MQDHTISPLEYNVNTLTPHEHSKIVPYCNISIPQLDYLVRKVSESALILYMKLYTYTAKTKGIFAKPIGYIVKISQWCRRKTIRLLSELVNSGCILRKRRNTPNGRLCNEYALITPQEVVQKMTHSARVCTTNIITTSKEDIIINNKAVAPPISSKNEQTADEMKRVEGEIRQFIGELVNVTNPKELFDEMIYAIKKRFHVGQSLTHALNTAKKLVKNRRWSRPFGLRRENKSYTSVLDVLDPDKPIKCTPKLTGITGAILNKLNINAPRANSEEISMGDYHVSGKVKRKCQRDYMLPGEGFTDAVERLQTEIGKGNQQAKIDLFELLRADKNYL